MQEKDGVLSEDIELKPKEYNYAKILNSQVDICRGYSSYVYEVGFRRSIVLTWLNALRTLDTLLTPYTATDKEFKEDKKKLPIYLEEIKDSRFREDTYDVLEAYFALLLSVMKRKDLLIEQTRIGTFD